MLDLSCFFFLLIIFQLKHFTGNFSLRNLYLSNKMFIAADYSGPSIIPTLLIHSSVHAAITLGIVLVVRPSVWYLACVDLIAHFLLDYVKLSRKILGRWDVQHPLFWWGLDLVKLGHNFVYYYFVYILLTP